MIILIWVFTIILLIVLSALLINFLIKNLSRWKAFNVLMDGIKEALRGCGFKIQDNNYKVQYHQQHHQC